MEDSGYSLYDLRAQSQKISYVDDNKVLQIGYFMRFAEYSPEAKNVVGVVAVVLDKNGKIHYRDPKSIRFVFE
jgi:hypothetical protein